MSSLVISDKEKYGESSPAVSSVGSEKSTPEQRKSAPTLELTGPQVTAMGLDRATVGAAGKATIAFTVKSVRAGESYSDSVESAKTSPTKVTIQITDAEPIEGEVTQDGEAPAEESAEGEEPAAAESESDEDEADDGDDESEETPAPKAGKKKKKKPSAEKDAESATSERVSPAEADLP